MRYVIALALILVVGVLGGGNDGLDLPTLRQAERVLEDDMLRLRQEQVGLDGTPDSILRGRFDSGPDIRAVGRVAPLGQTTEDSGGTTGHIYVPKQQDATGDTGEVRERGGGLDGLIIEATEHWGVEWAADTLAYVRFKESSNIVVPCKVGDSGERGPYQFMAGTWASTPYADLDPCGLEAATFAAAWFVSEGRWLEWTTWPR